MLQDQKNIEELEREEFLYKDDIQNEEDVEEEEEKKGENIKDKISNYFTAKSKKSGLALAFEGMSNICFAIDTLCTVLEKIKNLLLWKSKSATILVFFAIIGAYFFVTLLPIRYFLIALYIKKFLRGRTYYDRVYKNNIEIGKIEICRFLENENFDFCDKWPQIKNLDKKLSVHLQTTINIFLPNDWLAYYSRPIYLLEKIGGVKRQVNIFNTYSILQLQDTVENEKIKRTNPNLYKRTKNGAEIFLDYVMNNVPSDLYLMKYSDTMISRGYP